MKIVIINRHPNDFLGGSETQCDNIATCLTNRGHEVYYIAPSGNPRRDYNTSYKVVAVEPSASLIVRAVELIRPDVVYWRFNKYQWFASARGIASLKIPIVFAVSHINDTRRFSYLEDPAKSPKHFLRAIKQALQSSLNYRGFVYADALTSLNPDFIGMLPVKKQVFVPNSVETVIERFSWPRPYVVWVSNLKSAKRPELFIRLCSELREIGVDFLMVGEILAKEYDYVRDLTGKGPFYYMGKKSLAEVNGILQDSLALIHTCKPEGFGNNFIQAWKLSVPTVSLSFDPGGYITKYKLGGAANSNWTNFKSSVERLIVDKTFRCQSQANCFEFSQNFSIDHTTDIVEDLLEQLSHPADQKRRLSL